MRFTSGKQVNLASGELKVNNAPNHHWCETSLLPLAILNCVVSRQFCWSYPDCLVGQQV